MVNGKSLDRELARKFFYPELVRRLENSNGGLNCRDRSLVRCAVEEYIDTHLGSVGIIAFFDDKHYAACYRSGLENFGYKPPINE